MKIAFLGIGFMGFPMSRRLCEAGHSVRVWNRSRDKAERLAPWGATVHDTPGAAAAGAEVVISMLESGSRGGRVCCSHPSPACGEPPWRRGTLMIDMASIKPRRSPWTTRRDSTARGIQHLDAPVSGGTVGAEAGTLAIMAGGARSRRLPSCAAAVFASVLGGQHACGPPRRRAARQIGQPDDRGHHHRRRGRVPADVRARRCQHGQGHVRPLPAALPTAASSRSTASAWWSVTSRPARACRCSSRTCATPSSTAEEIGFDAPITTTVRAAVRRRDRAWPDRSGPFRTVRGTGAVETA